MGLEEEGGGGGEVVAAEVVVFVVGIGAGSDEIEVGVCCVDEEGMVFLRGCV